MIRFPFPDSKLSPNKRSSHRWLKKERDYAREIGYWLAKDAGWVFDAVPLELTLIICPPDRRRRDDDNIVSSFKAYRDGIFKALGLDDSLIRRTVIERGDVEAGGAIYVILKEMKSKQEGTNE